MANIYSDMGRFLQESFSIDDTFKKSSDKKLNESLQESFDNQVTLPEVLGWLSEHETAYEDCKRHFGMDFDDPDFDEIITVHDLEEWISEHEGLWADYLNHFNITDPFLDESLKESVEDDDLTEVFLKYHEDADNFRANQSGFDAMYEILSKYGDPDEYVDEVFKRAPREEQLKMVSLITPKNMDESLKEDFSDARPAATKIFNFIEMGADPADILDELLRFLPDSALVDFADYYGENFLGIGDDWDLDESLKESLNESINNFKDPIILNVEIKAGPKLEPSSRSSYVTKYYANMFNELANQSIKPEILVDNQDGSGEICFPGRDDLIDILKSQFEKKHEYHVVEII